MLSTSGVGLLGKAVKWAVCLGPASDQAERRTKSVDEALVQSAYLGILACHPTGTYQGVRHFLFYLLLTSIIGCHKSLPEREGLLDQGGTSSMTHSVSFESSKYVHDFGIVRPQTMLQHEFKILNITSAAMHPTEFVASCSCVRATCTSAPVQPGDLLVADVSFWIAESVVGDSTQRLHLQTRGNEGSLKPIIEVKAGVRRHLHCSEREISWYLDDGNANILEKALLIFNHTDYQDVDLVVSADQIQVGLQIVEVDPKAVTENVYDRAATQCWKLDLKVDDDELKLGWTKGLLRIYDAKARFPGAVIPIAAFCDSAIRAYPKEVVIVGELKHEEVKSCSVEFASSRDVKLTAEDFLITFPEIDFLDWKLEQDEFGRHFLNVAYHGNDALQLEGLISVQVPRVSSRQMQIPLIIEVVKHVD